MGKQLPPLGLKGEWSEPPPDGRGTGSPKRGPTNLYAVRGDPRGKTPILLTLEFPASASHWPNPTGIKQAKVPAPAAMEEP